MLVTAKNTIQFSRKYSEDLFMNNELFNNEKEIDLKDMTFYICKRWRSILVGMVIFMIAVVLIKLSSLIDLNGAGAVLKQTAKYLVIGIIVGLLVMAVVYGVLYIFTGRIKSESDFKSNCRLSVLGVLPKTDEKRQNCIDRFIRRIFGIYTNADDFEKLANRLAEEIKALLSVRDCESTDCKHISCVSVVSTEGDNTSKKLSDFLESGFKASARVISAGDILTNAQSVQTVMESNAVIVVEKIGSSQYPKVEEELKKLVQWDRVLLGIVLLDGDSI